MKDQIALNSGLVFFDKWNFLKQKSIKKDVVCLKLSFLFGAKGSVLRRNRKARYSFLC